MKAKFVYTGIRVKDLDESIKFYTEILSMKLTHRAKIKETKGEIAVLEDDDDGKMLELNYYDKESPFYVDYEVGEALDHLAFKVDNLDKTIEELNKRGIKIELEIKSGDIRWIYIKDPNGIWIEIYE
jgi:lactoylglutathione lyase